MDLSSSSGKADDFNQVEHVGPSFLVGSNYYLEHENSNEATSDLLLTIWGYIVILCPYINVHPIEDPIIYAASIFGVERE